MPTPPSRIRAAASPGRLRVPLVGLAVAVALVATGCGAVAHMTATEGHAPDGKVLFKSTAARATRWRTPGRPGRDRPEPRHDVRHRPGQGFDESTIRDVVRGQIAYPETETATGGPGMPAESRRRRRTRTTSPSTSRSARACPGLRTSAPNLAARALEAGRRWPARLAPRDRRPRASPGNANRSRVESTMPRSSQFERPSGCVEMISSSGREDADAVLDRLQRVAVADLAAGLDAGGVHRRERRVEPLLRRDARLILVGDPVPELRVQRRADDEHLRAHALGAMRDLARAAPRRRRSRSRRRGSGARPPRAPAAPAAPAPRRCAVRHDPPDRGSPSRR